jgi:hypothetical protein
VGGDPADVHAAAVVLDNNENVEAAQEDRIDVGEVDREALSMARSGQVSAGRGLVRRSTATS